MDINSTFLTYICFLIKYFLFFTSIDHNKQDGVVIKNFIVTHHHNLVAAIALIAFSVVVLCSFDSGQAMVQDSVNIKNEIIPDSLLEKSPTENNYRLSGSILPNEGFTNSLIAVDGISIGHAMEISNALRFHVDFRFLKAGEEFKVVYDSTKTNVIEFEFKPDVVTTHKLTKDPEGNYEYEKISLPVETRNRFLTGKIETTLNQALLDCDIPVSTSQEINGILECVVNFRTDARLGDQFTVFMEEYYFEGHKLSGGKIHYVSYSGRRSGFHEAFRFDDTDPLSAYNAHYTKDGKALIHSALRLPVDKIHVTSTFGQRRHPVTGKRSFHSGVDYRGHIGDPVYAVAKGKVIYSGYDKLNGNKVVIKHSDGTKTYYIHLDKSLVKKGQTVKARQQIAKLGRTGRVTGPHLHFGIKDNKGKWANPLLKRMIATPKLTGEKYARFLTQIEEIDQKVHEFKEKNKLFSITSL
ncbi:MAG: peptidoglycan DD-metalloendopeptidase family protein [Candidatus Delongbacteria bacterium]|nr:peptidoglycan DD-metalloendopeptidase family protein [Candidatus Delongbacteria bacterium]